MKSSLWIVIVVVAGLVGFLVGYSVSPPGGAAPVAARVNPDDAPAQPAAHPPQAGGYGAAQPATQAAEQKPLAPKAQAGGYGSETPGAAKPAETKTAAGGRPAAAGGY